MKKIVAVLVSSLSLLALQGCKAEEKYYIDFVSNGGSPIAQVENTVNFDANVSCVPTHDALSFSGWYLDQELVQAYDHLVDHSKNLTLYAKWIALDAKVDLLKLYTTAYEKHLGSLNSYTVSLGDLQSSVDIFGGIKVNLKLKSIKQVKDNQQYYISTSFGKTAIFNVSVMTEAYQQTNEFEVKVGSTNDKLEAGSVKTTKSMSAESYLAEYGVYPRELNYEVNANSVVEIGAYAFINGLHQFEMKLDNDLATAKYKKNIKATNQYDSEPAVFEKIILVVRVNQDGFFDSITYQERYSAKIDMPVVGWKNQTIDSHIVETFNYRNDIDLVRYAK